MLAASVRGLRRSHGMCRHPREHIEVAPRAAWLSQIVLHNARIGVVRRKIRVLRCMQPVVGRCLGVQCRFVRRVRRVRMLRAVP